MRFANCLKRFSFSAVPIRFQCDFRKFEGLVTAACRNLFDHACTLLIILITDMTELDNLLRATAH